MLKIPMLLAVAVLLCPRAGRAQSETLPIAVSPLSLATTQDKTQVPYYVLDLPVPEVPADARLAEAYLEFYMDASSTLSTALTNGAVTLEVFPFPRLQNGKLDVSNLGTSSMKRSVAIGNGRRVRVYVTEFVGRILADPKGANRSLIVGSVAGDRTARFDAKTVPGTNVTAKALLTVHFRRIEEARARISK